MTTTASVMTPTIRATAKRGAFWVVAAVVASILVLIGFAAAGASAPADPLSASNPAPAGAKAVAAVLREQGVEVVETGSFADTERAVDAPASTTILFYDAGGYFPDELADELASLASNLVIVDPSFGILQELAPSVAQAGVVEGALDASCSVPAAERAERITGDGEGYRVINDSIDGTVCFPSGDGVHSLVRLDRDGTTITIIGATRALSNEAVAFEGNAALALGLLGETDTLVWYLPTFDDIEAGAPPTAAELTPEWVIPVSLLALVVAFAAAIWRGRRFGPLIVENLPVVVRSSETMLGRARLYQQSAARGRALDALRIGTIARIASSLGLPRTASVGEVVTSTAAITGWPVPAVRALLVDDLPRSDRELVALSDQLLTLERLAATAARPARMEESRND